MLALGCGHFLLLHLFKPEYARYLHAFTLVMMAAGIVNIWPPSWGTA